jgi:hypothetical protein
VKLWRANVSFEVDIVIAADEEPDEQTIHLAASEELRDNVSFDAGHIGPVNEVREVKQLPQGWPNALPYGERTDNPEELSCEQILDRQRPEYPPLGEQQDLVSDD